MVRKSKSLNPNLSYHSFIIFHLPTVCSCSAVSIYFDHPDSTLPIFGDHPPHYCVFSFCNVLGVVHYNQWLFPRHLSFSLAPHLFRWLFCRITSLLGECSGAPLFSSCHFSDYSNKFSARFALSKKKNPGQILVTFLYSFFEISKWFSIQYFGDCLFIPFFEISKWLSHTVFDGVYYNVTVVVEC